MDLLRSCYTQNLLYQQGSPNFVRGTWYFAKPGAAVFPGLQSMTSGTWDTVHPTVTTIGWDATKPRTYYNGRRTNHSDGKTFAGPIEYFTLGQPSPAGLVRGVNGTPAVCIARPAGVAKGGSIQPPPPPPPPVPVPCLGGLWKASMQCRVEFIPTIGFRSIPTQNLTAVWNPTGHSLDGNFLGAYIAPWPINPGFQFTMGCNFESFQWTYEIASAAPFSGWVDPFPVINHAGPTYFAFGPSLLGFINPDNMGRWSGNVVVTCT